ncbi:unnamed protein product [Closterium sp. Naga37s-1]|nr:unnamed protein product [Closterium sp. Naga37s-1]
MLLRPSSIRLSYLIEFALCCARTTHSIALVLSTACLRSLPPPPLAALTGGTKGPSPASLCLHPSASTPTGRQQQRAWRSSGSSVASGRGEWWDDARPGLALLTTALAQPPGSTSATDRGVSEWRCGSRGSVAARRGAWPSSLCLHPSASTPTGRQQQRAWRSSGSSVASGRGEWWDDARPGLALLTTALAQPPGRTSATDRGVSEWRCGSKGSVAARRGAWPSSLCLHPSASTPTGRQQQKAWRSSGSSVASGRGEWWDDARPGLALLTTALAQPPGSTSATDRGVSEWRCGSRGSVAARRGAWPSSLCLHPSASTPTGRQQQRAWRSSGSSVASGRGEWWDDARPGLALLTTALAQPPGSTSATDRAVSEWRCGSRGSVAARRGAWPSSLCLHPSASTPTGRQQQKAWRSSGSSVASGRGEWWDDARPGLALLTTALAQPPGSTSATDRGEADADGREEAAAPGDGREGAAAPVDGREEAAAPVDGREEAAAPVDGREEAAAPVDGREEAAAPVDGREEAAAPGDSREEAAAPVDGREEAAAPGTAERRLLHLGTAERRLLHLWTAERRLLHLWTAERRLLHLGTAERRLLHLWTAERRLLHLWTAERSLLHLWTAERRLLHLWTAEEAVAPVDGREEAAAPVNGRGGSGLPRSPTLALVLVSTDAASWRPPPPQQQQGGVCLPSHTSSSKAECACPPTPVAAEASGSWGAVEGGGSGAEEGVEGQRKYGSGGGGEHAAEAEAVASSIRGAVEGSRGSRPEKAVGAEAGRVGGEKRGAEEGSREGEKTWVEEEASRGWQSEEGACGAEAEEAAAEGTAKQRGLAEA